MKKIVCLNFTKAQKSRFDKIFKTISCEHVTEIHSSEEDHFIISGTRHNQYYWLSDENSISYELEDKQLCLRREESLFHQYVLMIYGNLNLTSYEQFELTLNYTSNLKLSLTHYIDPKDINLKIINEAQSISLTTIEKELVIRLELETIKIALSKKTTDSFVRSIIYFLDKKKIQNNARKQYEQSMHDEVTGLFNQRKLTLDLKQNINIHSRKNEKFCLLFIDVDRFKNVNDNWGHIVGSRFLVEIGAIIKSTLRGYDLSYRYGGDEFIILMPFTKASDSRDVATRLGQKVKDHTFIANELDKHNLSISIGICEYPTDAQTSDDLVGFADDMMYKSKKSGRGKVFHVVEVL